MNQPNTPKKPPASPLWDAQTLSRYFLLIVLFAISVVFYNMLKIFLIPVFLAAVFAGLIYPLYEWLLQVTKNRRGLSAFLACLLLGLIMLIPTYIVADLLRREVVQLYQQNEETVQNILEQIDSSVIDRLAASEWVQRFGIDLQNIDLVSSLREGLRGLSNILITLINKTWAGTFQFMMHVFIMFFTLYYFFKDGERLLNRIKYLSPLNDCHEEMLFKRFISMSRATVKGTLLIGLTQGGLGALLLWIMGFGSPIVAGIVMFFLSIIPMVGAWLVLYPIGFYYMLAGSFWQGMTILLVTAIVISNLDNFMRPKLVGRDTGMHDLLIFFSTIGGMSMFGVMGFIVGPVIATLFLSILEIYSIEFRSQLEAASAMGMEGAPQNEPESAPAPDIHEPETEEQPSAQKPD